MMMSLLEKLNFCIIENRIKRSYSNRFKKFGATAKGVFWKNNFTQDLRLDLIINAIDSYKVKYNPVICDIGCGYGRLYKKLQSQLLWENFHYFGLDINEQFINYCKSNFSAKNAIFLNKSSAKSFSDFTVMSGTFNLCTFDNIIVWESYLCANLKLNWKYTKKAMIFNLLHKNKKQILNGLYYSDKHWIKKFCEINFGQTDIIKSTMLPEDILVKVSR